MYNNKSKEHDEQFVSVNKRMSRIEELVSPDPETRVKLEWPVPDVDHLNQIESKVKAGDVDVIRSLEGIWSRSDRSSLYKFASWNLRGLLRRTGRWTWTGVPSNSAKNAPESRRAQDLESVALLKRLTMKLFADKSEQDINRAFMNVFYNTNDTDRKRRIKEEKLIERTD